MTIGRRFSARLLAGSALCTVLGMVLGAGLPAVAAAETTYERLLNSSAEPQNWLMRMGNYSNWNHSTLSEINRNNVANLKVKFMFSLGDPTRPARRRSISRRSSRTASCMWATSFTSIGSSTSVNGKPKVVWKHDAKVQGGGKSAHSVALLGNNLYFNTGSDNANPRLVALDKNSGEVVFEVSTNIPEVVPNQGSSSAPLAVKDKIMIGGNRGENGRGYVAAYTADTGKLLWQVPGRARPGDQPAPRPGPIQRTIPRPAAAAMWTEPSFDPETNLAYFGTANPVHMFDPQGRPGRQSLHQLDHRARCRYRKAEVALPDRAQRGLGL